jgi:hypothetical protein
MDRLACVGQVVAERAYQSGEIHVLARLDGAVVAREGQRLVEHGRHGVQIGDRLPLLLGVVDQLGAQPQTGQQRAQIVCDGREHARAVIDQALNALLHLVEGLCRLNDLARPRLGHGRGAHVGAEPARGLGEAAERYGHPPGRPDRKQRDSASEHREAETEAQEPERAQRGTVHGHGQPGAVGQLQPRGDLLCRALVNHDRRRAEVAEHPLEILRQMAAAPVLGSLGWRPRGRGPVSSQRRPGDTLEHLGSALGRDATRNRRDRRHPADPARIAQMIVTEQTTDRGDADARHKRQEQAADQDHRDATGDAMRRKAHYDRLTGWASM